MKILRVRFFNLNSLRGEHEVDFGNSPLSDAGLFAITGPTGAGKTTILDAITLALYGQVPRHEGSGPEAVMSHGTGESWAEVEFQAGGKTYRAKWGQHRGRRRPENPLQDSRMELSEQQFVDGEEAWPFLETYKSRVPAKVAEISGLEYRQFLRSVLLAQGEFTKFLKSTAGERAQLLEKLTDTRKYSDISKAAYERAKQETQRVETLRAGLAGVALLGPDEVAELEADVQELDRHLHTATADQQRLTEAQAWRRRLDELTGQQQRGQVRLHQLTAEAETLMPTRQRVARHEQALPFQTPWALLCQADEQHRQLGIETEQLRQQLPRLQTALETANAANQHATTAHDTALTARRRQTPLLDKAAEMDVQINADVRKLDEDRKEYDRRNEQCKHLSNAVEIARTQQKALQPQVKHLHSWLLQHQQAADYGEALGELTAYSAEAERLRGELGELQVQETSRQNRLTSLQAAARQGQAEAEKATLQLAELQRQQQQAVVARGQGALRLHHHQLALRQEYATRERSWQDLRRLIEAQKLILSHEEARRHLALDEPCPLCGALAHPFVTGETGISAASLSQDHQREQELEHHLQQLQTQLNQVAGVLGMVEDSAFEMAPLSATLPALSVTEEVAVANALRNSVKLLRALEQQSPALLGQLNQAVMAVKTATEQQQELTSELKQLRFRLHDAQERQPQVQQLMGSICSSFGLPFSGENGPVLIEKLKNLGAEHQQQLGLKNEYERQLDRFDEQLKKDLPAKEELQVWLKVEKEKLVGQHQAIKLQSDARQQLFAGTDIAAARQQLQAAEDAADQERRQAEQQAQVHQTAVSLAIETLRQREHDAARQAQARDARAAALEADLRAAGLPPAPTALAERLLPDDMAQRLTQQLSRHDEAMAVAQNTLTETARQLQTEEGRALTPEPLAALTEQLGALARQLAHLNQQLGQRQERLSSHRNGLERHAALATELEKQQQEARRWRQLAEVIGSADGKKFSEFAQGLTLARLVDLANRHLVRLTDRYRILRNPDEHLDLLILDEYQAGSTRSMNSLSGGESFLVSLALALGLSELAGRKTQIDTLFIDEGFGTLDPDALDVALTALEMLQGTGKTIGIISHVEALKERVSTQINVRKGAGGVSTIRVVGL